MENIQKSKSKSSELLKGMYPIIFMLFLVIVTFLVTMVYEDRKDNRAIEKITLIDLKNELDSIHSSNQKLQNELRLIQSKLDTVDTGINNSKSKITNIYKTEIHEKSELNKSNDSTNLKYFSTYIDNWIESNKVEK